MFKQPTPIQRGGLDEAYDAVTKDADAHSVDKPIGLLQAVTSATKNNGDARIAINLSTVLATIFGVIVLAVAGRVFLNAVALTEVKILLQTSSVAQTQFRTQANARFETLRSRIDKFQETTSTLRYRIQQIEAQHRQSIGRNE